MIDWERFWCCMTPGMKAQIDFLGDIVALPDPVIAVGTYDAAWAANVGTPGSNLYDWFAVNFHITFEVVEVLPGVFLDAAVWTLGDYLSYNLFKGEEEWSCPDPCKYTSFPFSLP